MTLDTQLTPAVHAFTERFGRRPALAAAAPGRVNLIGEHTDYNEGFVLPMAIDRWTVVVADPTPARQSTLWAIDLEELATANLTAPLEPQPTGFSHLLGVAQQFIERGVRLPNIDLAVTSTVPIGGGLGSSAALEVAMATLLEQLAGSRLAPLEKALLCQRAEHTFVATPCGIMDMLVAAAARPDCATLIDCRRNTLTPIPLPPAVTVLIADTGVRHELAAGAYADRRSACEQVAAKLGVRALRDADASRLQTARLSDTQHRIARHVVHENQRTLLAAAALKTGDHDALGELMFDSHASLRDLFEVSCPQLDTLVEAASAQRGAGGVIGARMTGGGFGGCAVIVCHRDRADAVAQHVRAAYQAAHGRTAEAFATPAVGPARALAVEAAS
ncbi:MAG: galactokinase [Planctomycetota bacterium]|jgi:galactokinase